MKKFDISRELIKLKFNVTSKGFLYWIEAIRMIEKNPLVWDMIGIYEEIAKNNYTTPSRVERCMRYSMEPAKENIQNEYEYYNTIKNQTFLSLIKIKLI